MTDNEFALVRERGTAEGGEPLFSCVLTGDEAFLAHHVLRGQKVLPGAVLVEMVRAAVLSVAAERRVADDDGGAPRVVLREVLWLRPVVVMAAPVTLYVKLLRNNPVPDSFQVFSHLLTAGTASLRTAPGGRTLTPAAAVIHCRGRVACEIEGAALQPCDIGLANAPGASLELSAAQCYAKFAAAEIEYGATYRGLRSVKVHSLSSGIRVCHAHAERPRLAGADPAHGGPEHAMIDTALQATLGLLWRDSTAMEPEWSEVRLPFSLQEIRVIRPCPQRTIVQVCEAQGSSRSAPRFDIRVCDERGEVCILLRGLTTVAAELRGPSPQPGVVFMAPYWETKHEAGSSDSGAQREWQEQFVVFLECEPGENGDLDGGSLAQTYLPRARCLRVRSVEGPTAVRFTHCASKLIELVAEIAKSRPSRAVLVQLVLRVDGEAPLLFAMGAILRSARLENPNIVGQLIGVSAGESMRGVWERVRKESQAALPDHMVCYQGDVRQLLRFRTQRFPSTSRGCAAGQPFQAQGVYLITGGSGGLGAIFGREIALRAPAAKVIIAGRSEQSERKVQQLLEELGVDRAQYHRVDVADEQAVVGLVQDILAKHGRLDGVIHSAGVTHDGLLIRKHADHVAQVLAPKVSGLANLDRATCSVRLDFFVAFASGTGVFGNAGQCDYAVANAFMDAFMQQRDRWVKEGQRSGVSLSIDWPLWADGGMRIDAASVRRMSQDWGLEPLGTQRGIEAFYRAIDSGLPQVAVVAGREARLPKLLARAGFESQPMRHQAQ